MGMIPDPENPKQQAINPDTGELWQGVWIAKSGTPAPALADLDSAGWIHVGYGKMSYVEDDHDQAEFAALRSWVSRPHTITVTGRLVLPDQGDTDHE